MIYHTRPIRSLILYLFSLAAATYLLSNTQAFSFSPAAVLTPSRTFPQSRLLTPSPYSHYLTQERALSSSSSSPSSSSSTRLFVTDDTTFHETTLQRFRRRKVAILQKRKAYKTAYLFALWYVLSIGYNIYSKKALNLAPQLCWTTASFQMSGGLLYVAAMWLISSIPRSPPSLSRSDMRRLAPVAILHALVHIGGVVSMGAGAVSFTYVVKASEPAISAVLGALTGSWLSWGVYATLIPVIGGVAMASVSELTFTWKSFGYAMLSNVASASRGLVGKKSIDQRLGQNMTPMNLYAVLTIMASLFLVPLAFALEGHNWIPTWKALQASRKLTDWWFQTACAAMFYYTYNEVAFLCLDRVSPVSHAIANTVKRIFIIVSSMLVFGNKMTMNGFLGSTLAVGGVLWYSLEKQKHKKRLQQQKK